MSNAAKPGVESSEWNVVKWIMTICGIVGTALAAVLAALTASGTLEANSTATIVIGSIVAVLAAVSGVAGKGYIDGRSAVKVAELGKPE